MDAIITLGIVAAAFIFGGPIIGLLTLIVVIMLCKA